MSPPHGHTIEPRSGLLTRLWQGHAGLPSAFWGAGVLGGIGLVLLFYLVWSTQSLLVAALGLVALWAWVTFAGVAIWRAAGRHRGGRAWPLLARAAVVIGTLNALLFSLQALGLT